MTLRVVLRHIIGYFVGLSIFVVGIPSGLYLISAKFDRYLPFNLIAGASLRIVLSLIITAVGIVFMVWSNLWLFFVGKGGPTDTFGVAVSPRTRNLITNGPYRYTRNPMVFGALSLYLALSVFFNSVFCLGLVTFMFVIAPVYLKRVEETRLLTDFGKAYEQYRKTVSILVPFPPRRRA